MDILKLWLFNTNTNDYEFEADGTLDWLFESIKDIEPKDSRWVIATARNHVICSGVIPIEWSSMPVDGSDSGIQTRSRSESA